ncbi:glycosyltransferase involved in cell wall biosynthesis [Pedobacter sp. W3I1]|uniref:glycosyltransferase family 2 protein n=1 Tax=Pedobacter sp. W3I1 TaxID=3042291 RepID=UPI002782CC8F|nr:glycosyltransferase family 2 protein [Pedobacter sp. W3I1]MDQ0641808.1 glycosyltransferase involved in cell wall biosynthesis [Pedobacter sp. W3I1]
MENPLISVVMCTYNGEKYLKAQIESVLAQTYTNFEIIIVDDFSSDNTVNIIEEYANQYQFIQFSKNERNLGFNKNFERAIGLGTGDFIAICDQDDIWYSNKLERLQLEIGSKGVIFSNSRLIDENGEPLGQLLLENPKFEKFDYRSILINNYVTGHTILAKRMFLLKTFPFPEHGYYDWWIGFLSSYYNELGYLNEVTTDYRVHRNSVVHQEIFLSDSDLSALAIVDYKSTKNQLRYFYNFLKQKGEESFINHLMDLYLGDKGFFDSALNFIFFFNHYNILFPLQKRRKFLSKGKFLFIREYWNNINKCKQKTASIN